MIEILSDSKETDKEIKEKMKESVKMAAEIDSKREGYRPSANRSSTLFFCLLDMMLIDHMYQYSLTQFKKLFENTIKSIDPVEDPVKRTQDINKGFTKEFFDFTCRSLFEKDKQIFAFVVCVKVLMNEFDEKYIKASELKFLLQGPKGEARLPKNPFKWVSENDWKHVYNQIYFMSRITPALDNFDVFFLQNPDDFKDYFESQRHEKTKLPGRWENDLTMFQKLLIIKALRPDKLTIAVDEFISKRIGKEFTDPPTYDPNKSFSYSSNVSPLLFVLTPGSDPINDFKRFAEEKGIKWDSVSLGKGMDKIALTKVEEMKNKGGWIILQNCHLGISFMPKLEEVIESIQQNATLDGNFRLWLTSMSDKDFSINVLKESIKITMEPPKGLRLNLLRQYNAIKEEDLNCSKPEVFKSYFFGLCFFHAIVQDRRKFGPIGWNDKYDFTNEDLDVTQKKLKNFIEEYDEIPFKVINYLGAVINYGGRVTDDKDQRLIQNIFESYIKPELMNFKDFSFSSSGKYYCPEPGNKDEYINYIKSLPYTTSPEVFGLHDNAEIVTAQTEGASLLQTMMNMQPRESSGKGGDSNSGIMELIEYIEDTLPKLFDEEAVKTKFKTDYMESMNTVFTQEVIRYNTLLEIMYEHIKQLKLALSGKIVMSDEIDKVYQALFVNRVPQLWITNGFLTLKPLVSWLSDLKERIEFFDDWFKNGIPKAFALSSKFLNRIQFPTGIFDRYVTKLCKKVRD